MHWLIRIILYSIIAIMVLPRIGKLLLQRIMYLTSLRPLVKFGWPVMAVYFSLTQ